MSWNPQQGWPPDNNQQPFSQPIPPQYPYAPPSQQGWPAGNQQPFSQQYWPGWQANAQVAPASPTTQIAPKSKSLPALIKGLPSQYLSVVIHPSEEGIVDVSRAADWRVFWLQMVFWLVISTIFTTMNLALYHHGWKPPAGNPSPLQLQLDNPRSLLNITYSLFSSQIGFLIYAAITYLLARLFGGKGAFLEHFYTTLTIALLVGTLSYASSFIPLVNSISGFMFFVYQVVLYVVAIKTIHDLSGCIATLTVALLLAVAFVSLLLIGMFLFPGSFVV